MAEVGPRERDRSRPACRLAGVADLPDGESASLRLVVALDPAGRSCPSMRRGGVNRPRGRSRPTARATADTAITVALIAAGMAAHQHLAVSASRIERLGSRSSWAGQRAIQPWPTIKPPSALAIVSARIGAPLSSAVVPSLLQFSDGGTNPAYAPRPAQFGGGTLGRLRAGMGMLCSESASQGRDGLRACERCRG